MKGVQCYELFGGIALKNHAFFREIIIMSYYCFFLSNVLSYNTLLDGITIYFIICFVHSKDVQKSI